MKKFLVALIMLLIVPLITVATMASAMASEAPGVHRVAPRMHMCSIRSNRAAVRQRHSVPSFDPTGPLYYSALMYHRIKMYYRWCKNGQYTDTVEFLSFGWCSEKRDNAELPYVRGTKWNIAMGDMFHHRTDPPGDHMPWQLFAGNGGDWRCRLQDFTDSDWYFRNDLPFWQVDAWVDLQVVGDLNIEFPRTPSRTGHLHYLGYSNDPKVS